MEKHHQHQWPPQLPLQYPVGQLKSERSSSLADPKSNGFMVPWTPSQSIDLLTHICFPFLYPKAVGKHHEHQCSTHHQSQYPIVHLKSERSSSLADPKSNRFMVPWTPSQSIALLTHICPPFLYLKTVGKHHEQRWPPQLPSQYPIVQLKSERSSSLAAWLTQNLTGLGCHGTLQSL